MVESSGKTWSTGEGNGKPLQYSCLENPMNSRKRQNNGTLKDELPRLVGAQYATGDQWRNKSRKNEEMEPKQKQHPRDWATNEGAPENQEGPRNEGAVASDSSLGLSCLICKQRLTGPIAKTCFCYGIKLGHRLRLLWCWTVFLEMNWDHSIIFKTVSKNCILNSFIDYSGYSISSKGVLPTVVDIMVIWVKFTYSSSF